MSNITLCPFRGAKSRVYDCRITVRGTKLRRRECPKCRSRFKTEEYFAGIMEQPMKEAINGEETH